MNDDTIYETEGQLPDGRVYRAELWQLGDGYHMTIFVSRGEGETAEEIANEIEFNFIEFCGTRYRNVQPVIEGSEPYWSYNVVVCDDQEQFVSRLPLIRGTATFSVWYGERQVELHPPRAGLDECAVG